MIRATAPGKVVLWGEYAVLAGAPALVMAVDRRAACEIGAGGGAGWHIEALGHPAPAESVRVEDLGAGRPPDAASVRHVAWHVLAALDRNGLPAEGRVTLDTRPFQDPAGRGKLGLGSSAALTVAVYAAFARLLGQPCRYEAALDVHRRLQGGRGSGIDVAAAWHGGTCRFRRPAADGGEATPWPLPRETHLGFVFAGAPSATGGHLERLEAWLARGGGAELDALADAAGRLFAVDDPVTALPDYVERLEALDRAAGLGIYSEAHRRLARLATTAGVVYKPCGAGGGDIGAAFSRDAAAIERFCRLAADRGFLPLALETASHGVEVTG